MKIIGVTRNRLIVFVVLSSAVKQFRIQQMTRTLPHLQLRQMIFKLLDPTGCERQALCVAGVL
jgi:hypothetical protein